jgi:CheY-like chemotaxis protein
MVAVPTNTEASMRKVLRLLLVDDSNERWETIRTWVPAHFRLVWADSAGHALGLLARSAKKDFVGIMLDYDLHQRNPGERKNGLDVARSVVQKIDSSVPVLVLSTNEAHRGEMVRSLESKGFDVTLAPMDKLERTQFLEWLQAVEAVIADDDE